jgi:hypothetical protein
VEIAERHELEDEIPVLLHTASYLWYIADENRKALNALLRIRDAHTIGIDVELESKIQNTSFSLVYDENPDLDSLQERVEALDRLSRSNSDSFRGLVCNLRNSLFTGQGMWQEALKEKEVVWANRETALECETCALSGLVTDSLDAKDREKAEFWMHKMRNSLPKRVGCELNMRNAESRFALYLGLANDAEKAAEAHGLLVRTASSPKRQARSLELRIRAHLLNDQLGDPLDPLHPAYQLITGQKKRSTTLSRRFGYDLLVADFRLACLRYACGFRPLDDLYYNDGNETCIAPPRLSVAEISRRLQRVQRGLNRTQISAAALDHAFRCSWRIQEIKDREQRVHTIITSNADMPHAMP